MSNRESEKEYWRWTESRYTNPDLNWEEGDIISAGVDVGSVSAQAVIMVDGEIYCYSSMRTGSNSPDSANNAMDWALEGTGLTLDKIQYIVGTGYGRVNVSFAKRAITEIACHARGANFIYGPEIRTVLDMGGQDCKAIRCDQRGKVTAFLMNDKCAAGTGRGMEVFADLLQVHINDVGKMSLEVDEEPEPVSSTCVVFAKSEAVGLLRKGWPKEKVLAAYCSAMAHRVVTLLMRLGIEEKFAITGGIAKNIGVVKRLEDELKLKAPEPSIDPQLAGSIGAALFAKALFEKERKKA
ncbi:MAG: benzoyl-CoA reductase, bzd-type, subunit Q [Candidatus Lokiarchaeota archaeon]|nr:benzoyl-CoA reductase, bzd-type, subunit Q [Candidatus Lokiarchaeota archaeon]